MWFKFRKPYSRSEILEAAGKALAKGKRKKGIAWYQKLLKADPEDHVVHGKIAPLLAETRQFPESWSSFKASAEGYLCKGFDDKALSIYIQATRYIPREIEAWEAVTRLQVNRRLRADAVKTLINGHRHFRHRKRRQKAIRLLCVAKQLDQWNVEVTVTLARLLAKAGEKRRALQLLAELAEREQGCERRRICGALVRISPTPASVGQWLRAALFST
jgi:tetratricopeptide (TPR) repeat protein